MHPDQPTAIPDRHGDNLFLNDPSLAGLLRIYLPDALYQHLEPRLSALGAAAGGHLDTGARRRSPPAHAEPAHPHRAGSPKHRQAPGLYRAGAAGLLRIRSGGAGPPPRRTGLAGTPAAAGQVRVHLSAGTGRVRAVLPAEHDRLAEQHLIAARRRGTDRTLSARAAEPGFRAAVPGRDVHHRTRRRLRCVRVETRAYRQDGEWRLEGDKWFCSIRTPAWPWCWPMSTARRTVSRALACSCCRVCCPTASPTATASSA